MQELKHLFINDVPLIDVRAPIEFEAGHFPTSINLPILNNDERQKIGTCYKNQGKEAAITLGHQLVSGDIKAARIEAWSQEIKRHPNSRIYCFRGGLRSQITCQWLKEAGIQIELIPGGYKKIRQYLLSTLEDEALHRKMLIIGGRTGSAKTKFIASTEYPFIDLENMAHHKGSSFGILGPQPSQVTFENRLAIGLLKLPKDATTLFENESVMIGKVNIPKSFYETMKKAPLIAIEKDLETRARHIVQDYVFERTAYFLGDFGKTKTFMLEALDRIQKKLGGVQYVRIAKEITEAFDSPHCSQAQTHEAWVTSLLVHYYDPLYDRALERNRPRLTFQGTETECHEYLNQQKEKP